MVWGWTLQRLGSWSDFNSLEAMRSRLRLANYQLKVRHGSQKASNSHRIEWAQLVPEANF